MKIERTVMHIEHPELGLFYLQWMGGDEITGDVFKELIFFLNQRYYIDDVQKLCDNEPTELMGKVNGKVNDERAKEATEE